MDELTFRIIEAEREADEHFATVSDAELAPTVVIEDSDGARVAMYADGSYAAFDSRGSLL